MKYVVTALVISLVAAAGAGAYNMAVTPAQFAALKRQVTTLQQQARVQRAQVTTLQQQARIQRAAVSDLESQVGTLRATSNPALLTCLQKNWNEMSGWATDIYAINGVRYDSSSASALVPFKILMAPTATWTDC